MKFIKYPNKEDWAEFTKRPEFDKNRFTEIVSEILKEVKLNGDKALIQFAEKFDNAKLTSLKVSEEEIEAANPQVSDELKSAINVAKANIEKFHITQLVEEKVIETTKGVKCWRKSIGIEKVGLYIPGGSAPLFSTVLMLAIPAKIAGCKEVVICTPPNNEGKINSAILYAASLIGVKQIFKVGGSQAVAAMAFGTESVPKVYKIFGPGNQFVTKAKELAQQEGTAIDMPAGPSEVLVIADKTCNPIFVAADLLSQAEHGPDSQVVLVSDDEQIIAAVSKELNSQIENLPRVEIAKKAIKNSISVLLKNIDECIDFSNEYAPEHLIIASDKAEDFCDKIINAGSVFLGNYSCESAGDYASGTNHTLPTNGYARNYSGVSVDSFVKKITFQQLEKEGIRNIGPSIEIMAEAEELFAHKNAVSVRLKALEFDK